ncbi:MAG: O-antigen ligase family protein [Caldilineaceae bacterium]
MAKTNRYPAPVFEGRVLDIALVLVFSIVAVGVSFLVFSNYVRYSFMILGIATALLALLKPRQGLNALLVVAATVYFAKRLEYFIYKSNASEFNNPISILPELIIVCLFVSTHARVWQRSGAFSIPKSPLTLSVISFLSLSIIEIFNPKSTLVVGLYGFRVSAFYILMFFIGQRIFATDKDLFRYLQFSLSVAVLVALYGIWQQFVQVPLWDQVWFLNFFSKEQYSWMAGAHFSWAELRKFSLLKAPASAAFFYVINLLIVIILSSMRVTVGRLITAVLLATALAITYVRGAWIACMISVSLSVLLLWLRKHFRRPNNIKLTTSLLGLLGIGSAYILLNLLSTALPGLSSGILQRVQSLTNPFHASEFLFRANIWRSAIGVVLSNPLGLGIGATGQVAQRFISGIGVVDSIYFKLSVELGWLGLTLFFIIVYQAIKAAWLVYLTSDHMRFRGFAAGVLGLIVLVIVNGIVGPLLEYDIGVIYFWLLLGVLDSIHQGRLLLAPPVRKILS